MPSPHADKSLLADDERLRILRGRLAALKGGAGERTAGQRTHQVRQCENAIAAIVRGQG